MKDMTDSKRKKKPTPRLEMGSQYLCHASIDVPNTLQDLCNLEGSSHLHLVIDVSISAVSDLKDVYDLRLVLKGFGYPHAPKEGEEQSLLYQVSVVYGGLFGVIGQIEAKESRSFVVQEASGYLFPSARTILLNLIRESGFPVHNIQPINFREFWENTQTVEKRV